MVRDIGARDEFIEENLGLVHSICRRFSGRGIDYDDLFQTGCIGLIKAVEAFDEDRGLCFSTYAFPVIMGEVKRLFRDGGAVKVSRSLKELSLKVIRERDRFEKLWSREPSIGELAEALGVSADEIAEAVCAAQPVMSLTYEGDNGVKEYDLPTTNMEEELSDKLLLEGFFKVLNEDEQRLIHLRYYEGLTQSKTAEKLSMSQVQVSRTEKKILKKLKGLMD
ncbi:MAG: sigma-70 family RNA polymerase sigma factor [Clostridia bacterium]|nr:sigma-70 family RNA polymerase sigma factor [Clostridia bacterium]